MNPEEHELDPDLCMPTCRGFDIEEISIEKLQEYLKDAQFSVRELTECYLERINRINRRLKAVLEINPDALEMAEKLDRERENGIIRSPLHGIPYLVKDNIATKDKMQTTAGSSVLVGTTVSEDACVVSFLREAGAVLLGHANMSEWACMRSSSYSEGYSSRGGQCRNPYNLAEDPGGSSSGSAVAVAANMCAFSLGTETDGSVIFPADRNGIVGIKPTVGLTSCKGVIPCSRNLDTVGVFGRTGGSLPGLTRGKKSNHSLNLHLLYIRHADPEILQVRDAAFVLEAITGQFRNPRLSFTSFANDATDLKGAKFGLPYKRVWEAASNSKEVRFQYESLKVVLQKIKAAGAEVIRTDFPSAEEIIPPAGWDWEYANKQGHPEQSESTVVKTDFYNDLKDYISTLATNPHNIKSLEDIVSYNVKNAEREGGVPGKHLAWPTGQDVLEHCVATKGIEGDIYQKALAYIQKKSREEGIDAALLNEGLQIDGLLVPIQAEGGVSTQVAAKAGYPIITIPVGIDSATGVPFGLGIIQTAGKENLLIKYGSAIENLIKKRTRPGYRNFDAENYMYTGAMPDTM